MKFKDSESVTGEKKDILRPDVDNILPPQNNSALCENVTKNGATKNNAAESDIVALFVQLFPSFACNSTSEIPSFNKLYLDMLSNDQLLDFITDFSANSQFSKLFADFLESPVFYDVFENVSKDLLEQPLAKEFMLWCVLISKNMEFKFSDGEGTDHSYVFKFYENLDKAKLTDKVINVFEIDQNELGLAFTKLEVVETIDDKRNVENIEIDSDVDDEIYDMLKANNVVTDTNCVNINELNAFISSFGMHAPKKESSNLSHADFHEVECSVDKLDLQLESEIEMPCDRCSDGTELDGSESNSSLQISCDFTEESSINNVFCTLLDSDSFNLAEAGLTVHVEKEKPQIIIFDEVEAINDFEKLNSIALADRTYVNREGRNNDRDDFTDADPSISPRMNSNIYGRFVKTQTSNFPILRRFGNYIVTDNNECINENKVNDSVSKNNDSVNFRVREPSYLMNSNAVSPSDLLSKTEDRIEEVDEEIAELRRHLQKSILESPKDGFEETGVICEQYVPPTVFPSCISTVDTKKVENIHGSLTDQVGFIENGFYGVGHDGMATSVSNHPLVFDGDNSDSSKLKNIEEDDKDWSSKLCNNIIQSQQGNNHDNSDVEKIAGNKNVSGVIDLKTTDKTSDDIIPTKTKNNKAFAAKPDYTRVEQIPKHIDIGDDETSDIDKEKKRL